MQQDTFMRDKVRAVLADKNPALDFLYVRAPAYAGDPRYSKGVRLYYIGETQVTPGVYNYLRKNKALTRVGPHMRDSQQFKIDFEKAGVK